MALWLVRAGSGGAYETKFLDDSRIYLTWNDLTDDLSKLADKEALVTLLLQRHPDKKPGTLKNWSNQIWSFARGIEVGDWVVLPSKKKSAVHIGKVTGDYVNTPQGSAPYFHYRSVEWFATDIPRQNFPQDILYSFGAFLTICRIKRNDAEARVKAMASNNWHEKLQTLIGSAPNSDEDEGEGNVDLQQLALDQVSKLIISKYKGHGLEKLVNAILEAQGFTTYQSPEGTDKGVDILAAPGVLGFGHPRLCVQVKSSDSPVDRPTLDQLVGAMQNFKADQGLLVSWGGFKSTVDKEVAGQFFNVRLWDSAALIEQIFDHYEKLDEDVRAEIPLKRMWAVAVPEEDG